MAVETHTKVATSPPKDRSHGSFRLLTFNIRAFQGGSLVVWWWWWWAKVCHP